MVGCSHHGVDDVAPNAAGAASMPNKDTKNNFFMFFLLSLILSNFYIVRKQLISRYSHSYVVVFSFLPVGHVHSDVVSLHVPPVFVQPSLGDATVPSSGDAQYPHFVLALVSI